MTTILLGSPAPTLPLRYTALYLLHESKLFSPARNLAPTPWEKWCVVLGWTLYFISANKSHFILYLGKAGWQQPKNVKKIFFARPPEFIYFLTYSKRVIRLLYFVDFLNKVRFSFSTVMKSKFLGYGFLGGWDGSECGAEAGVLLIPGRTLCWRGELALICK